MRIARARHPAVFLTPVVLLIPWPAAAANPQTDPAEYEAFAVLRTVADQVWPDVPLLPALATGATDGLYLRNAGIPTYTIDFLAEDPDDDRTHGRDERIRGASYYQALELWYRLLQRLGGAPESATATATSAP